MKPTYYVNYYTNENWLFSDTHYSTLERVLESVSNVLENTNILDEVTIFNSNNELVKIIKVNKSSLAVK